MIEWRAAARTDLLAIVDYIGSAAAGALDASELI